MARGLWIIVLALCLITSVAADNNLALLATNMIPGGGNYVLDCGPAIEHDSVVNNLVPDLKGADYCVMSKDGKITIGTYVPWTPPDIGQPAADVVATYKSYTPHLSATSFPADLNTLCGSSYIDDYTDNPHFQACQQITTNYGKLYPYMYKNADTVFLLISDTEITAFRSPSTIDTIINFFKGLFGISTAAPTFIDTPAFQEFHHGYFARQDTKQVIATWSGNTASIIYQNFVTDFSKILPDAQKYAPQYELGENSKQRIIMTNIIAPDNVNIWRQYTSGLRITSVTGTPLTDTCGNGHLGFDEECDRKNLNGQTCESLGFKKGELSCMQDCKFNTTKCPQCISNTDCADNTTLCDVASGKCVLQPCYNGIKDGDETDQDCGGSCTQNKCANDQACKVDADCASGFCVNNVCTATKPFVCNYNGAPDAGEDPTCRDMATPTENCPTVLNKIQTQGAYTISTRADLSNKPQIIIAGTAACKLQSDTGLVTEIAKGTDAQEIVLYQDSYGAVNLSVIDGKWHVKGRQTAANSNFQTCWGTTVNQPFDIAIPINDVATCVSLQCVPSGGACSLDSDCCRGTYAVACTAGTCQRDYIPPCDTQTTGPCRDRIIVDIP